MIALNYKNESQEVWHFWGGQRPLAVPICGFLGKSCPFTFFEQFRALIIVFGIIIFLTAVAIVVSLISTVLNRRMIEAKINSEWQIPIVKLRPLTRRKSYDSRSTLSLSSDSTMKQDVENKKLISEFHGLFIVQHYENELVLVTKYKCRDLTAKDTSDIVKLRALDHDNLNKFIGMSIDGSQFVAVWKFCSRGSLQDLVAKDNFSIDYFFMYCMIRDVAEVERWISLREKVWKFQGLNYIHRSFLRVHGSLRSSVCLVNEAWQVKIASYGLDRFEAERERSRESQLWQAPEVLRNSLEPGSMQPSADIYSFAIVASEILNRQEAWNLRDRKEGFEGVLFTWASK